MARFYASVSGSRGPATRVGNTNSGIQSHTRGWDIGCFVQCKVDDEGKDIVQVVVTTGSNGEGKERILGTFKRKGKRIVKVK